MILKHSKTCSILFILYVYFFDLLLGVFKSIDQIFSWNHLKDTVLVYLFWVLRISFSTSKSSRSIGNTNSWTVCFLIDSFEVHKLETMGKTTTAKRKSIGKDANMWKLFSLNYETHITYFAIKNPNMQLQQPPPKKTRCHWLDKTNLQIYLKNR